MAFAKDYMKTQEFKDFYTEWEKTLWVQHHKKLEVFT
jgi:hypothetical protein